MDLGWASEMVRTGVREVEVAIEGPGRVEKDGRERGAGDANSCHERVKGGVGGGSQWRKKRAQQRRV